MDFQEKNTIYIKRELFSEGNLILQLKEESSKTVTRDDIGVQVLPSNSTSCQSVLQKSTLEAEIESQAGNKDKPCGKNRKSSLKASRRKKLDHSVSWTDKRTQSTQGRIFFIEIEDAKGPYILGSLDELSIKTVGARKVGNSLTGSYQNIASNGHPFYKDLRNKKCHRRF